VDADLKEVIVMFAEETREQCARVVTAILGIEQDPSSTLARIEEVFRELHTIKGAGASLGVAELERLAHQLESALTPVRRGRVALSPSLADLSLRAVDAVKARLTGLLADGPAGLAEVEQVATLLERASAESQSEPAIAVVEAAPAAAPAAVEAESDSIRIPAARIGVFERRLDQGRSMSGRLELHATTVKGLALSLEQLWRRASQRNSDGESRVTGEDLYPLLRQLGTLRRTLSDDAELARAHAAEFDEDLRAIRMVSGALLADPLRRAVREACRRSDKDAQLVMRGGEVEIDRRVLEEVRGPLLHIVRNAMDHGIEAPAVREAIGKMVRATITVTLSQRGNHLVIEVSDDGRGIDTARVLATAIENGVVTEDKSASLSPADVLDLIFLPGFTTARELTEMSGRGVGLDVVRSAMARLHGRVEVSSQLGAGAIFTMWVPLTIAGSEAMVVEECGRPFALPLSCVEQIVRVPVSALRTVGGRRFYYSSGEPLAVIRLSQVLNLTERHDGAGHVALMILEAGGHRVALWCEKLVGQRDLMLCPMPIELQSVSLLHGMAILPDGQTIFILAPRAIVEAANRPAQEASGAVRDHSILVADDSITTRSLLRNALEASGYRVRVAADGDEALRLALGESFDLVVSDVRMPRLDGFQLTARLKADPRTARLPVLLFSSLDSDEDRRRGSASGARAYLTKGAFDRGYLLEVVSGLIGRAA
jgi:two-component system chemotaxis sensor kinase CheA